MKCVNRYNPTFNFVRCPSSNVTYNILPSFINDYPIEDWNEFSVRCPNDPNYYQACGDFSFNTVFKSDKLKLLCGMYVCEDVEYGRIYSGNFPALQYGCNGVVECKSGVDEVGCDIKHDIVSCFLRPGQTVSSDVVCDGFCDCVEFCEDELLCNGYSYQYKCSKSDKVIPGFKLCDDEFKLDCLHGDDKELCSGGEWCFTSDIVPHQLKLTEYSKCLPWVFCINKYDQLNCSDPALTPLKCLVGGYLTAVSRYIVCSLNVLTHLGLPHPHTDKPICDDMIDRECVQASSTCYIHKHQMCDSISDCADGSDENSSTCDYMTVDIKCVRAYSWNRTLTSLPSTWILDNVVDCENGLDEDVDVWPDCEYKAFTRYTIPSALCEDVYLCRDVPGKYVEISQLCDNMYTCKDELEVCNAARSSTELKELEYRPVSFSYDAPRDPSRKMSRDTKFLLHCLPGLQELELLKSPCMVEKYPSIEVLGTEAQLISLPLEPVDCSHVFGEVYVYLSCSRKCRNTECPLSRALSYNSCPDNEFQRIYSLADSTFLTLVYESGGKFRIMEKFECATGSCLPYSKVCNLEGDCSGGSDEGSDCSNSFTCNIDSSTYSRTYIPWSFVCDNKFDCSNLRDECNTWCNLTILNSVYFKVACWIIGTLAVLLNITSFIKNISTIGKNTILPALLNRAFIIVITIGDVMVGSYLLSIAVVDSYYGNEYCILQREWLTSPACSVLGVVSTTGTQLSLFAMTFLSLYRFYSIKRGLAARTAVGWKYRVGIMSVLAVLFAASLSLAIVPLFTPFQDLFVNAIYYPDIPLFKDFVTKELAGKVLRSYYGRTRLNMKDFSWDIIGKLIKSMFTNSFGTIQYRLLNFYGNDGVCLFKYFVRPNDPQRNFTWTVLILNFTCFIVIFISYQSIKVISRRTSQTCSDNGPSSNSKFIQSRNQRLQRKIATIIITDLLCWVPFVIISGIHTMGLVDATKWYGIFSILILPINSVINPLLYDATIITALKDYVRRCAGIGVRKHNLFNARATAINTTSTRTRKNFTTSVF